MKFDKTNMFNIIVILSLVIIFLLYLIMGVIINKGTIKEKEMIRQNYKEMTKQKYEKKRIEFKNSMIDSLYYLKSNINPEISTKIINSIIKNANKNNIPPLLILCLIFQESSFNHMAHNDYGAIGLMQIVPKYHEEKIKNHDIEINELYYIDNNITIGTLILKEYFNKSENIVKALQKYVGASVKSNASKYIENILNSYITLQLKFF